MVMTDSLAINNWTTFGRLFGLRFGDDIIACYKLLDDCWTTDAVGDDEGGDDDGDEYL